jgi:hypothetical protein
MHDFTDRRNYGDSATSDHQRHRTCPDIEYHQRPSNAGNHEPR